MRPNGPIKVLIFDGSALVRTALTRGLRDEQDIEVVAAVGNPAQARRKVLERKPDVIVLDLDLPGHDSITFLRVLSVHYPVPVIVCGCERSVSSPAAQEAIETGAVEVVCKPAGRSSCGWADLARQIAGHIRAAQVSKPVLRRRVNTPTEPVAMSRATVSNAGRHLIAIGASTGGTEAIRQVLAGMSAEFPPVVIVQHMPVGFTRSFAGRLDRLSALEVREAVDGQRLHSGLALLARGDAHMELERSAGGWRVRYGSKEPYNRHCPSVDVLFNSVAAQAGSNGVGILLTGMGNDGAEGLLAMRRSGAKTFAQDKDSCVVYGMPKVAAEIGAAECIASPGEIPRLVAEALASRVGHGAARVR